MNFKFKFDRHFYILLIFLRSIGFWVAWVLFRPNMPLTTALIYRERGQDIEYLPNMAGLGTHGLRDAFDCIFQGTNLISFPPGSIWLHSLFYKLAGVPGFIIADFCIALSVFFLLSAILKEFRVKEFIANSLSLFVVIGVSGKLTGISKNFHLMIGHENLVEFLAYLVFIFCAIDYFFRKKLHRYAVLISGAALLFLISNETWEYFAWRFPRPFVTEVYFLLFALITLRMMKLENIFSSKLNWAILGISTSLLLESEIYRFFLCGLLLIVFAFTKLNKKTKIKELLLSFFSFLIPFSVLSLPFAIQRMSENPDVPRRFGAFAISRLNPMLKLISTHDLYTLTLICVLLIYGFSLLRKKITIEQERAFQLRREFALFYLYLFSFFSLPLFMIFTGKLIQPEHFNAQLKHVVTLITIIGVGVLLSYVGEKKKEHLSSYRFCIAIALIAFVDIVKDAHKAYSFTDHTRSDFEAYNHFPNYLEHFSNLLKKIQTNEFPSTLSLATFDMQVSEWWNTVKHGNSFVSDVFINTISDNELENRIITLTHLLGFKPDEFIEFINEPMMKLFFISSLKYRFSNGYTYSNQEDYPTSDQSGFRVNGEFNSFNVLMPNSERNRLRDKFTNFSTLTNEKLPDLIILQTHPLLSQHAANSDFYEVIYSDEVFRVWKKK